MGADEPMPQRLRYIWGTHPNGGPADPGSGRADNPKAIAPANAIHASLEEDEGRGEIVQ